MTDLTFRPGQLLSDLWLLTFFWREVINRLTWTFRSGQMTAEVFLKRCPTIQKKGAKTCSYWFLFFFNETPISSLVKNDMTLGVWIEKDRRTIGTGDAGVFLIRYPTIQKKGTKTCSYWFLFFSNKRHTICLVKNTIPQAVWIEKDKRTIWTGNAWVLLIRGVTVQKNGAKTCSY